ncbi:hypothetical protein [Geobacillus thermoleovorans]|nr:hypothetical protein [Geobacillus thermoleovorans]
MEAQAGQAALAGTLERLEQSVIAQQEREERRQSRWEEQLAKEEAAQQAVIEALTVQSDTMRRLEQRTAEREQLAEGMAARLEGQEKLYQKLIEQLELQHVFHETVIERLEAQEAAQYKVTRQLDSLKEALYERCSFIIDSMKQLFHSFFPKRGPKPDRQAAEQKQSVSL